VKANSQLASYDITSVNETIFNVPTNRQNYLYLFTEREGLTSELVQLDIVNEVIIEITTVNQLNAMITSFDTIGKYYILKNDLDLTTGRMDQLSTANVFGGIFDGGGYTLKNYSAKSLRGG